MAPQPDKAPAFPGRWFLHYIFGIFAVLLVLLLLVDPEYVGYIAGALMVWAAVLWLYWLFQGYLWIVRFFQTLRSFRVNWRAKGLGHAWRGVFKVRSAEEIAGDVKKIRGIWLAVGILMLAGTVVSTRVPLFVFLAFVVGLMFAGLLANPPATRSERARWGGPASFVLLVFAFLAWGSDATESELVFSWGAGYICGAATLYGDDHPHWQGVPLKQVKAEFRKLLAWLANSMRRKP